MSLPVYEAGSAAAYCSSKGWTFKRTGDQLLLDKCPFCSRQQKFYINDQTGLWDCKHAACEGQKGNFYQLLRAFGDAEDVKPLPKQEHLVQRLKRTIFPLSAMAAFEEALEKNAEAVAYLQSRGLTLETAKAWHLGFKETTDGVRQLLIPYVRGTDIVDVKYRLLPSSEDGRRPKYTRYGGESILFGQQMLAEAKQAGRKTLYLCEGEFDAMTLRQHGYWPVLSTTTGAASFKSEWFDTIVEFEPAEIVLCYDSDASGQKGAEALTKRFEQFTVKNIVLPDAKDVNEYFQSHANEDFDALVASFELPELENVKSTTTVLNMLEEQLWFATDAFDGLQSMFPDVNAMCEGGFWNGQLVTLSGPSGTGKTSYALQELLQWAKQGIPTYLLCLEMPEIMMMRKIFQKEFGIPMLKLTQAHVQEKRKQLEKIPFFMGTRHRSSNSLADVEKTIRAAVARYDIKCVAFDNINYFVRSIDHTTQEIAKTTQTLKDLAVELNIPIIAIAQPRKFDKDSRVMSGQDLKDSSAIEADSDTIIILHRQRIKSDAKDVGKSQFLGNQSPYTLVRVEKARYSAGGETTLYFDGARSTYRELSQAEKDAMQQHG